MIKKIMKADDSLFLNIGNKPSDQSIASDVANIMKKFFLQNKIIWNKSISLEKFNIVKIKNVSTIDIDIPEIISIGHYQPVNRQKYLNNCFKEIFHFTHSGNVKLNRLANGFAVPYKDKSNIGRYSDHDKRDRGNSRFIPYETIQSKDEILHHADLHLSIKDLSFHKV